jgi:hypothetical protein
MPIEGDYAGVGAEDDDDDEGDGDDCGRKRCHMVTMIWKR